ncbi:hypothetical protein [uncultured Acetobacteroides sp.]|uniref:gasdermin n=1 Tax=uncultured Acetobacteroides sp. TaxID=1760811 RepID=UPI0029F46E50|nr:hypothetical protein [uncultured Acetobacteroides sp.]
MKLCNNDNFLVLLRDTFKACPIRIPEERIKPIIVYSQVRKKYKYIGDVVNLLNDNTKIEIEEQVSQMASLSATKTKSVDAKLGLEVMGGFLQGFGTKGASLDFAFKGVKKISFSFQNVSRSFVDVGKLCDLLSKRKFNLDNPVNKTFVDESAKCIIIDSVIKSDNFSICVEESTESDFKFDISEIQKAISSNGNNISTKSSNNLNISFQGDKSLAFAFSGFIVNCDEDGSIYYEGEPDKMNLTVEPTKTSRVIPPYLDFIESDFGLLEFE